MPKVSIILPTYNGARWIKNSIQSVLNQSFSGWELLVINDGSVDNTDEVVAGFTDERIKYIKNENNIGLQKTLNKGISLSGGEYIARIDEDDEWIDVRKLEKQVEYLDNNQKCVLVGTGGVFFNEEGVELVRYFNKENNKNIRYNMLLKNNFIHSSVVFRKIKAFEAGLYGEGQDVRCVEDYDFWLRLGLLGELHNLPIFGVRYLVRKGGISLKNRKEQFLKSFNLIKKYKKYYPNYFLAYLISFFRFSLYGVYLKIPVKMQNFILHLYKG